MRRFVLGCLVAASIAVWAVAGYRIGYAKGAGWRAAVIHAGCHLYCRVPAPPPPSAGL